MPNPQSKLLAAYSLGTNMKATELRSVSLKRAFGNFKIHPVDQRALPTASNPVLFDMMDKPWQLAINEELDCFADNTNNNEFAAVGLWLGTDAITPYTGPYFSTRATAAATLVAGAWTPTPTLTFDDAIPTARPDGSPIRWAVVGFRAESTTSVLARLIFNGQTERPGIVASAGSQAGAASIAGPFLNRFRGGRAGIFGTFDSNTPPVPELLATAADTAQRYWFDLVPV